MRIRINRGVALLSVVAVASTMIAVMVSTNASAAGEPYRDPTLPVATRVADLLGRMSLDEKLGQMTQAERANITNSQVTQFRIGSILSGGGSVPSPNNPTGWANMIDGFQNGALATPLQIPLIYGADAVHGHNNVVGATIFPHNIGLGATRNPTLVQQIGRAVAEEVTGTGVRWNFAPCLCVARNDRWGRTYESFGEKPEIASSMATMVAGLQGPALGGAASVLATAKHYVADGGTTNGTDQGNAQISEAELRSIHLPPFQAAIQRGVGSIMVSFSSWNGQKLHGHQYLLTTVLKGELGFTGFVVSDYDGINQIDATTGMSATDVRTAVNAGVDMVMVPAQWQTFISLLRTEVQAGRVPMARIDDANRRILTKKFELGLFERPLADRSYASTLGSTAHRSLARQAVAQSQVVLKNAGNLLPLSRSNNRIFVAGRSADNIGYQSGGWTITWQGSSGNITPGTTILQGIRNTVDASSTVTFSATGSGINNSYNVAIAVVGETPYAEGNGDRPGTMSLDTTDLNTIATLRNAGVPVVVVLVSGRPLDIAAQLGNWNALVAAWLPGTEGQGVADVLFNVVAPTGTLPVTWMQAASQQPINDGDGKTPLFPYGFGLTYPPTGDTQPPTAPGAPAASNLTCTSVTLTWAASTDNAGAVTYDVIRNGVVVLNTPSTSATITGLSASTAYQFQIRARDAAGNVALSTTVAVSTPPCTDTSPPTTPGTPVASAVTTTSVGLAWTASTDNTGVAAYDVVRVQGTAETVVASPTVTSTTLTGLTPNTAYTFAVYARDAAGNRSARSGTVTVATSQPTPTPTTGSTCRVAYGVNDWGGGFSATITITNTGTTTINGWTLRFTFPGNQQITNAWSATWSQQGQAVSATSMSWNGTLAPGASTGVGFNGSYSGANARPSAFTINNVACASA